MKNTEFLMELRNAKEVNIADMQLRAVGTNTQHQLHLECK